MLGTVNDLLRTSFHDSLESFVSQSLSKGFIDPSCKDYSYQLNKYRLYFAERYFLTNIGNFIYICPN